MENFSVNRFPNFCEGFSLFFFVFLVDFRFSLQGFKEPLVDSRVIFLRQMCSTSYNFLLCQSLCTMVVHLSPTSGLEHCGVTASKYYFGLGIGLYSQSPCIVNLQISTIVKSFLVGCYCENHPQSLKPRFWRFSLCNQIVLVLIMRLVITYKVDL